MRRPVVLPILEGAGGQETLSVGAALAQAWEAPLLLLGVVLVPPSEPLSRGATEAQMMRERLEQCAADLRPELEVRTAVRVGHEAWGEIAATCLEAQAALLVLVREVGRENLFGRSLDFLLHHPPCDLVILPRAPLEAFRNPLVGVRGGPNAELALRVAQALALPQGGEVTALHVFREDIPESQRWREERPYLTVMQQEVAKGVRRKFAMGRAAEVIVREAPHHSVVVVGATADPHRPAVQPPLRKLPMLVAVRSSLPVADWIVLRTARSSWSRAEVEKWFAENTFHAREFADLERLVALKGERGLTISLGLPALNEEETIGEIIRVLKDALMDRHPLLDEMVLVDSDSTDRTREIAASLGIPVVRHSQVLPQYGSYLGKGEALWKSLYVLRGDIVVWVDTDIRNMHPKFVYGLVGPLLREERIAFVKGYYRRPLQVGDRLYETGGGRVTELVARPLTNLFFPELSGLIQPLAGEYAGRREVLEQIPFFTGYGVEMGMLIDLLNRFGLRAIGQVDLEQRIHRNQSLPSLSLMAYQIVQVVLRRVEDRIQAPILPEASRTMKLIRWEEGTLGLEEREITEVERPPMITIPEYRARRVALHRARGPVPT
ncbi:MAG: glucosyl-3-phosphoglycerate synthase [Armatimonadetes bacterium]|nr:glucosyl-3-phosphoglycerate synthase [Armatimonadota bacterium]MDW8153741.1 glucosyl-3-phosphoglycerate synthase [Armatimonadota bacterium]